MAEKNDYWTNRLLTQEERMHKRMLGINDELKTVYQDAIDGILLDMENYISKYQSPEMEKLGFNEQYGDSFYNWCKKNKLDRIQMKDYRSYADELLEAWQALPEGSPRKAELMIKMRAWRTQEQLSILDAMKQSIEMHLTEYGIEFEKKACEFLTDEYSEAYMFSHYQDSVATGIYMPITINKRAVEELIYTPFSGASFADYVWQMKDDMTKTLVKKVAEVVVRGKGINRVMGDMKKSTDLLDDLRIFLNPNRGEYYGEYATKRILQTESSRIFNQARTDGLKERGHESIFILAEYDSRTCSVCRKNDGKEFSVDNNPLPFHPNCRCSAMAKDDGRRFKKEKERTYRYNGNEYSEKEYNKLLKDKTVAERDAIRKKTRKHERHTSAMYEYEGKLYTADQYEAMKKDIPNKSKVKRRFPEDNINSMSYKAWKEQYVTKN